MRCKKRMPHSSLLFSAPPRLRGSPESAAAPSVLDESREVLGEHISGHHPHPHGESFLQDHRRKPRAERPTRQHSHEPTTNEERGNGHGKLLPVRHVRGDHVRRAKLFERAAALKARFDAACLPRIESDSHIVPLHVGEAALCTAVSRRLLAEFAMYATPINYPTVPRGEERLRFTPTPLHTDAMMDALVDALLAIIPQERRRAA